MRSKLRTLLILCIVFLSSVVIFWVFVMVRPMYQSPSQSPSIGCGVTGCEVP
jgi:hypothetical protein